MKDHALSKGIGFAYKVIPRTPLDLARNESLTLVRTTPAKIRCLNKTPGVRLAGHR